jgi:hypothetical protein
MSDTNTRAVMGDNNPPAEIVDPMEVAIAAFNDDREEAETWLDGKKVENQGQLDSVEALYVAMREAEKELEAAKEGEYRPHKTKCDDVVAKYKPALKDYADIIKGLVELVGPYKKKVADEVAAKEKAAWDEARRLEREAAAKIAVADTSNIEQMREAQAAKLEATDAQKEARSVAKSKPKRMRKVTRYEIKDRKAALHWIAAQDRDAMTAFIEDYVKRNHKAKTIDGVRVWDDREAY